MEIWFEKKDGDPTGSGFSVDNYVTMEVNPSQGTMRYIVTFADRMKSDVKFENVDLKDNI